MPTPVTFIKRILGLAPPKPPPKPFNFSRNRYKAKKPWPPDVSKLSHIHQFKLEKKWKKRRAAKWLNPTWMKWTNIARWGIISGVTIFAVLFMDYSKDPFNPNGEQPFQWIRGKFWGAFDSLWTPVPQRHTLYKGLESKDADPQERSK